MNADEASPDGIDALKAALIAARAEVAIVRAQQSDSSLRRLLQADALASPSRSHAPQAAGR